MFGEIVRRTRHTLFIRASSQTIDDHSIVQANDGLTAGMDMSPWKHSMNETRERPVQHCPAKTGRMNTYAEPSALGRDCVFANIGRIVSNKVLTGPRF